MLTEKECREALENLKEYSEDYESLVCQFGENLDCYDIKPTYKYQKEIEIFEELITEYFKLQAQYCCVKTTADAMRDVIQHQLPEIEKELKNSPDSSEGRLRKVLTKEKCKNALDYLFDNSLLDDFASNNDMEKYNMLVQLINEHFDIPKSSPEVAINDWILCSERLPKYTDYYNVTVGVINTFGYYEEVRTFKFEAFNKRDGGWVIPNEFDSVYHVVAWQELPKPYEGGKNVD